MNDLFLFLLELLGTVAFAASGALVGMKKHMDIFGVAILGLTTAVGGGVLRDLILGVAPPTTFRSPVYAVVAICVALLFFLPAARRQLGRGRRVYETVLLYMDSVGLGVFTVSGVQTALLASDEHGLFLLVFVGVVTGIGGGIIRDVLAGRTPEVFVRNFYACASLAGALVCSLLCRPLGGAAAVLGALVVIVLRLCAVRFRWRLPRA